MTEDEMAGWHHRLDGREFEPRHDEDLREPPVRRQESQVSMRMARGPEARRESQGASRAAPGKSGLHARGEGERFIALESREGTRSS